MNNLKTIRASALVAVLALMVILITSFTAAYGYFYSRAGRVIKDIRQIRALYLADAGVNRFISIINESHPPWNDVISLKLAVPVSDREHYHVQATAAGAYILITSIGAIGSHEATRKALIGLAPLDCMSAAVINYSPEYPLVLAGQTRIIGDVIVRCGPVIPGALEGKVGSKEEMVAGAVMVSPAIMKPGVDNEFIKSYLQGLDEKARTPNVFYPGSHTVRELHVPYGPKSVIYVVEDNLDLDSLNLNVRLNQMTIIAGRNIHIRGGCRLVGCLEIAASDSIIVEGNTSIEGAILIANNVILIGDVRFRGQAISGGTIHVGCNSRIEYPSLLLIHGLNNSVKNRLLEFDSGSSSYAVAIVTENGTVSCSDSCIVIAQENSFLSGIIYSSRDSDLRGVLHGTSMTDSYLICRGAVSYINWLADASIDRHKLAFFPVLPVFLPHENGYAVFYTYDGE